MRQKMVLNKMAHFRLAVALQILLSATSYQAPIPPILDQSKTGFNRRDVGAVLTGSLMWSSSAFNRGRDLAVAASTGTKVANGYTSNGDTKFSLDVPLGWFISQSKGARLNGVRFSAGDYASGATVSVAETTVAALLAGEFAPTGPFKSFKDTYTKPLALADLLVRLRDGDLELSEKTGASYPLTAAWDQGDSSSNRLCLEAVTLLSRGATGKAGFNKCLTAQATSRLGEYAVNANFNAPVCDSEAVAAALRQTLETSTADSSRRSRAVALLVPPLPNQRSSSAAQKQGRIVVLWASAPGAWQEPASSSGNEDSPGVSKLLEEVLASFKAEPLAS